MTVFDRVVAEYDAGRPSYPDGIYDALEPLAGKRVVEIGAGTGIATRALLTRGASVTAIDAGAAMVTYAKAQSPDLAALVADGARLPLADGCADLVCCAQSWHWLDPSTRVAEMHRVLAPAGRLAAWWSHARVEDEPWFDAYWNVIEAVFPGTERSQADTDWGATFAAGDRFAVSDAIDVPWVRDVSVDQWITDQSSHSYVAAMGDAERNDLLERLRAICLDAFASGEMRVRYRTRLWIATRR
jgi:SAM-dependent methyltransferase